MDMAMRIFTMTDPGKTGYLIAMPHVMLSGEGLRLQNLGPGQWEVSQDVGPDDKIVTLSATSENIDTAVLALIALRMGYHAWFTPAEDD